MESLSLPDLFLKMVPSEFIGAITSVMTVSALLLGVSVAFRWARRQEEFREHELELRRLEIENASKNQQAINIDFTKPNDQTLPGSGGYIVLDLPDEQKAMFRDVLKGFEEFAKLRGYSISFSVDGSITNKIAFKFTILDSGVTVSTARVKEDLKDYVRRVKDGDDLSRLLKNRFEGCGAMQFSY